MLPMSLLADLTTLTLLILGEFLSTGIDKTNMFSGFAVLRGTLAALGIPPDRSLNVRHRQALSLRGKHPPGRNAKRRAPTVQKAQAKHAFV